MGRSHRRMSSIETVGVAANRSRDELFVRPRHAERGGPSLLTELDGASGRSAGPPRFCEEITSGPMEWPGLVG